MTWRRWLERYGLPLGVFLAILLQGATLGLTDDEAYYWVLAQRPAMGYAFHPPMIGWSVALAQGLFGWLFGHHCAGLVRLPAAVCGALYVWLAQRWIERTGAPHPERGGWVVAAFAGIFALVWMIVPDLPMFAGWTLAFAATWAICFGERVGRLELAQLAFGTALALLSKYTGVLGGASAFAAILLWAPRERRIPALAALALGGLCAAVPVLWWNSQHEWASILYQLRERHGEASFSAVRYARFWLIELVLLGPALAYETGSVIVRAIRRQASRADLYVLLWAFPAGAIFCTQPLWSDFKPHWALIVWWPFALGLALRASGDGAQKAWLRLRVHQAYGWVLIVLVWASCHVPLGSWLISHYRGGDADPRLDVTNDLYGWPELREWVVSSAGKEALQLPIVGSRYQTAAQAAFALGDGVRFTLLPRDLKARDEWPDLGISDVQGPDWPHLHQPVLYVADNRYDAPPEYPGSTCVQARTFEARRWGYPAKTIYLWKCVPRSARP